MPARRTLDEHLFGAGPKRILSLDGGGVRGLITLGMLRRVEAILKHLYGPECRVCDYFDLIGGTSTGGLVATLLCLGYDVDRIIALYKRMAPDVFAHRRWRWRQLFQSKFDSRAFELAIRRTLGDFLARTGRNRGDTALLRMHSQDLATGLALVTKRIDQGSVWVLTNNRKAKYWDPRSELWREHHQRHGSHQFFPNADYSLAAIVRASASAPFYLDGVELMISPAELGHFLDGGASPFNNPCQELFLMTTLRAHAPGWAREAGLSPYGFRWETGHDKLYMLSLGTGEWRVAVDSRTFSAKWNLSKALHALQGIISDADLHAVMWMQAISETEPSTYVNGNLLGMQGLRIVNQPLLSFHRVNPILESESLATLGPAFEYASETLDEIRALDNPNPANLERLLKIGEAAAKRDIALDDFPRVFDL